MHRNARLTPAGRLLLCQRIEAGWPVAHAAHSMGISRDRAYVWWRRYQAEGVVGLEDRSSRPHRSPDAGPRPAGNDGSSRCDAAVVSARPASPGSCACPRRRSIAVLVRHRPEPSRSPRPGHQGADPSDRDDPPWRARPRRHQEARPDPQRRRLASERPSRRTGSLAPHQGRLRLRALRHRRLQPPRLHRSPHRRTRRHRGGVLAPRRRVLRRARHHRRTGPHRQRQLLPQPRLQHRPRPHDPHLHPALPARHQRQGRALQPHPAKPNGPTPNPGDQKANAPAALPDGSTSTTITDTTPPSAAHPSAASATSLGHYS